MALSNWDTLALNQDGPCDGNFVSPLGISVGIYKNWLYVLDPQMARAGGRFDASTGTVMQVDAGSISYHDVQIEAVRGPQAGIYTVVQDGDQVMIGCGVYGWAEREGDDIVISSSEDFDRYVPPPWLGVEPESVEFLYITALELLGVDHPMMAPARWENLVRFNQGDAVLAGALQLGPVGTSPGESQQPFATAIFGAAP